jgi:hypothetical protein
MVALDPLRPNLLEVREMAIGVLFDFPDGTLEQYDEVCRGLNNGQPMHSLSDWPGGGILAHAASEGPNGGLRVFDVWESEEAFQRFGEKLGPLAGASGLGEAQPQITPLHNFVRE